MPGSEIDKVKRITGGIAERLGITAHVERTECGSGQLQRVHLIVEESLPRDHSSGATIRYPVVVSIMGMSEDESLEDRICHDIEVEMSVIRGDARRWGQRKISRPKMST